MLSDLPPVGSMLCWRQSVERPVFDGFSAQFVDSGTSALALACVVARAMHSDEKPEIILPAYGCPDLISAVEYAGCQAVLVDIASSRDPALCLNAVKAAITDKTAAVVAVNFLGVRERLTSLRALLPSHALLIEDNAQWFPEVGAELSLEGDISISSFGRGKPASMLGGGLLLIRTSLEQGLLQKQPNFWEGYIKQAQDVSGLKARLMGVAYHLLMRPHLYFWVSRNPILNIGATEFHPLKAIHAMSEPKQKRLVPTILDYRQCENTLAVNAIATQIAHYSGVDNIACGDADRRQRLLRYPFVVESVALAERLYYSLRKAGLGVTRMYAKPLPDIMHNESVELNEGAKLKNVYDFAPTLLTLPVHSGVQPKHLQKMAEIFKAVLS